MAIGKASDFKIYHDQFYGGFTEVVAQQVDVFNAASMNAIRLVTQDHMGDYVYESFMTEISGLVARRDETSVASVTDTALAQEENVRVRLARKIINVANTRDSLRKIMQDEQHFSFILGQQVARGVLQNYLNTAIIAVDAALDGQTSQEHDASGGTLEIEDLVDGQSKMGDNFGAIRAWVMHSKVYHDLMKDHISGAITNVADVVIVEGTPASLGKPIIVTDDSTLLRAGTTPIYVTLGLVENGIVIEETENEPFVIGEWVTGLENLVFRYQGEFDMFLSLKGFKYDVANGGANPNNTALGTSTNWDQSATDDRNLCGVHIISQ